MVSTRSRNDEKTNNEVNASPAPSDEDASDYDPASDEDFHEDIDDDDDEELQAEVSVNKESEEAERVRDVPNANVDDDDDVLEEEEEEYSSTSREPGGKKKRVHDAEEAEEQDSERKAASAKKKQKINHGDNTNNKKSPSTSSNKTLTSKDNKIQDSIGGIVMEYAKSGRASCRKCSETIDKNTPRVGMEAWITGRQSMTWQHVICFLQNLSVKYEKTGQSKCSITGDRIPKGEVKMVARSHTATRNYTMKDVEDVLATVLSWVPEGLREQAKSELSSPNMEGANELSKEDQNELDSIVARIAQESSPQDERGSIANQEDQAKPEDMKTSTSSSPRNKQLDENGKPKEGVVAKQQGTVEWNFAGGSFQGTLLPNKETKSQCFAKTHKGNIKTLNKGKDHWSIVDN